MKDPLETKSLLALGIALTVSYVIMALLVSTAPLLRWLSIFIVLVLSIVLVRMFIITRSCQREADELRAEITELVRQKTAAQKARPRTPQPPAQSQRQDTTQ